MPTSIRLLPPQAIAPETFVVRQLVGEGAQPFLVPLNTLVVRGAEPVLVDTGAPAGRTGWLDAVFGLVDPHDVRWIVASSDDADHLGGLADLLALCPRATVVTSWLLDARGATSALGAVERRRRRRVEVGESLDVGDRVLHLATPPLYGNPAARAVFDPTTRTCWAADAFACPLSHAVDDIDDLDPGFWREGFETANRLLAPWHALADPVALRAHLDGFRRLGAEAVASVHGVTLRGEQIESSLKLLEHLAGPTVEPAPAWARLPALLAAGAR